MPSRYHAYLSYSHTDERFAKWLHSGLEAYRVPKSLVNAGRPPRLSHVFRDRAELSSSSNLGEALDEALARSDALIVVCSTAAAASQWVNEEIRRYKLSERGAHIYPVIIEGEPPDCFPPALLFELDGNGQPTDVEAQPIAADARPDADGRRDALRDSSIYPVRSSLERHRPASR